MQPQPWPGPDPQIAAAIAAMYRGKRERPLAVQVRDRLGELFGDGEFAAAFGQRGKPGWSPGRLALVTVLQKAEDLTDRQAAGQVRENLAWKYALGLSLTDPGFDHSVLSEFRSRVVAHGLEERTLDLLLATLVEHGLLGAGGKQRTDSTHVIAAVRDLNRLELAGESVRAALEALSSAAPHWLTDVVDASWSDRYAERIDSWRMPTSKTKKDALALDFGRDGFALLGALHSPGQPAWLRQLPAVQTLRIVLLQNYTRTVAGNGREVVKRREKQSEGGDGLPPGEHRLSSPYDTDARWSAKRDTFWNGFKLHISESCRAQDTGNAPGATPNLITNVATTASTLPDSMALEGIHRQQQRRGLLPEEHYLDSGYPSAELIVASRCDYGVALIAPILLDRSRQGKDRAGFAADDFQINWEGEQVTCPAGQVSASWNPVVQDGRPKTVVSFAARDCVPCPFKGQCTRAKRRQLSLQRRDVTEAMRTARTHQQTKDWKDDYALRSGVEGTIRQATAVTGIRRARYRGLAKTHLDHAFSATAINLIRLNAWWNGHPLDRTRTSHLARLDFALTD